MHFDRTSYLTIATAAILATIAATADAREDREDPALAGSTLDQAVLQLIWDVSSPATRSPIPPSLAEICPKLAVSG